MNYFNCFRVISSVCANPAVNTPAAVDGGGEELAVRAQGALRRALRRCHRHECFYCGMSNSLSLSLSLSLSPTLRSLESLFRESDPNRA